MSSSKEQGDIIRRKEYEERHTAIQLQLVQIQTTMGTLTTQIAQLTGDMSGLKAAVEATSKQVLLASTLNKYLWPIVTIAVGIITFLLGGHV